MKKEFKPLSDTDIKEINHAISEAEKETSAEIVPVLVRQVKSDKSVINLQLKSLRILSILFAITTLYHILVTIDYHVAILSFISVGIWEIIIHIVKKKVPNVIHNAVLKEAESEFINQGVGETLLSNGVLLFISLEDKQVVILADEYLRMSHNDERWIDIIKNFQSNIKYVSLKESILKSIKELGTICKESCPKVYQDLNEIENTIRIKQGLNND